MSYPSHPLISELDYNAIEDELQSTQKGRRFLRAYVDRNRSFDSRRLLRSISRLHRAALGAPGVTAEVSRDLISVAKSVARHRTIAAACRESDERSRILSRSLQDVEASLFALIESLEERNVEFLEEDTGLPGLDEDRAPMLYSELSSIFTGDRL